MSVKELKSDHPRIRGEHFTIEWEVKPGRGSSPHTRGAPVRRHPARGAERIIPAYAGSTASPRFDPCWDWDHPRIRGEHSRQSTMKAAIPGSSPHTRGAQGV